MAEVTEIADRAKRGFDFRGPAVLSPANSRNEEKKTEDRAAVEQEIERLAQELARLVNEVPSADRDELRAHVVGLLREEVHGGEGEEGSADEPPRQAGFNPLGMGIPVLLVGAFLLFLFPPVGLLLFGLAAFLMIWGLVATLFGGRAARRG